MTAGPIATFRDVTASRRAQRQYRADLHRHLDAARAFLAVHDWTNAGKHLIAAGELGDQALIEKLREPVARP